MLLRLAVFALAVIAPPLILLAWLWSEWRAASAAQHDREAIGRDLDAASREVEALYASGDEEGLDRRADGRFDARSRDGRALNVALLEAEERLATAAAELQAVTEPLAARDAARAAMLVWLVAFGWFARRVVASALATGDLAALWQQGDWLLPSAGASLVAIGAGWLVYRMRAAG